MSFPTWVLMFVAGLPPDGVPLLLDPPFDDELHALIPSASAATAATAASRDRELCVIVLISLYRGWAIMRRCRAGSGRATGRPGGGRPQTGPRRRPAATPDPRFRSAAGPRSPPTPRTADIGHGTGSRAVRWRRRPAPPDSADRPAARSAR